MRILTALAIMLCPIFVSADPATKDCHRWFVIGQKLMTDRQAGRHMSDMLREVERLPEDQREVARKMVAQVFQFPRTRIGSVRQSVIREFADAALAACHQE